MERDYDKGLQNVWRKPGERAIESERERERVAVTKREEMHEERDTSLSRKKVRFSIFRCVIGSDIHYVCFCVRMYGVCACMRACACVCVVCVAVSMIGFSVVWL